MNTFQQVLLLLQLFPLLAVWGHSLPPVHIGCQTIYFHRFSQFLANFWEINCLCRSFTALRVDINTLMHCRDTVPFNFIHLFRHSNINRLPKNLFSSFWTIFGLEFISYCHSTRHRTIFSRGLPGFFIYFWILGAISSKISKKKKIGWSDPY